MFFQAAEGSFDGTSDWTLARAMALFSFAVLPGAMASSGAKLHSGCIRLHRGAPGCTRAPGATGQWVRFRRATSHSPAVGLICTGDSLPPLEFGFVRRA